MKGLVATSVLLVALVVLPETRANSQLENEIGFATCVLSEKYAKDPAHVSIHEKSCLFWSVLS